MTPEEKPVCNTKSNAQDSGQAQPKPTRKKAEDLTAEEWAELHFRWNVYALIDDVESLLGCSRRERKQVARFMDACNRVVGDALAKLYLDALRSRDFKKFKKRERALRFAMFERMGEIIDQHNHE
jgi:hypothetical protein